MKSSGLLLGLGLVVDILIIYIVMRLLYFIIQHNRSTRTDLNSSFIGFFFPVFSVYFHNRPAGGVLKAPALLLNTSP